MEKLLLTVITIFILVGCQSPKGGLVLNAISKISISESEGYGGLNENYFTTIDSEEMVQVFEEVVKSTVQTNGIVKKNRPDFDILVQYADGSTHGLHLSLGNEGDESILMYVGHESTTYIVRPDGTEKLRQMIETE
ncbi:hypothetical protein [Bacillus sp. JJ1562]|uniref:hypothetical protein n=1 Tax=Bacillus sp. JJ1562 TaxID=3122960 RepID=UPI003003743A